VGFLCANIDIGLRDPNAKAKIRAILNKNT
jgi:hypothetical protein